MTREEERREASIDYQLSTNPRAIGGDAFADFAREMNVNPSFIEGARWADSHPKKGLVYIDKAVRWLKDNAGKFVYISAHTNLASINAHLLSEEFAEEMSKYIMEE